MNILTTRQVADLLKVHRVTVLRWIRSGQLSARSVGGHYVITGTDLEAFVAGHGKWGRSR